MPLENLRPETLALHGGAYRADRPPGRWRWPIYQSTSFQFKDTEQADRLFALDEIGHIYTRVSNPTQDALETRLAALEGGAAALALASGQAARPIPFSTLPAPATTSSPRPTSTAAPGRSSPPP